MDSLVIGHSSMDNVVAVEQSERLYKKYIDNGVNTSFYIWAKGTHGAVGTDIEAATSEWIVKLPAHRAGLAGHVPVKKLLEELAPKK